MMMMRMMQAQQVGQGQGQQGGDIQGRSKEAAAMLALHEALRNVCVNYDWTYSVFWTIRPRPRCRGGTACKVGEDNGSLMLMWEDGYCHLEPRPNNQLIMQQQQLHVASNNTLHSLATANGLMSTTGSAASDQFIGHHHEQQQQLMNNNAAAVGDGEDPVWKAFRKMSIQLYNYGEGLMGKVASDKCHKWVFKESPECEAGISSYWQSSFDAHPPEWVDQFAAGIQTIAVIQAGQGLLQLGACKVIAEDLHFVLRMRHAFESLEYPSSVFLPPAFGASSMSMMMRGNLHVGTAANLLGNMYTSGAVGLPPPPSPHSWSLCTTTNQLQQTAADHHQTRAALRSAGTLLLKQSCSAMTESTSVNSTSCENEMISALQSPRLTLNPTSMMSPRGAGGAGAGRDSSCVNAPLVVGSSCSTLNVVASTPSSSKLYQRRFSLNNNHNMMQPAAKLAIHHQSGLPFLSNVAGSPPASISSLEALLSQRSPLHATSFRKSSQ